MVTSSSPVTTQKTPAGPTLLALGFRPFFLLAGLYAALAIPAWLLLRLGGQVVGAHLGPLAWHGHEMIFGYTVAVLAGFLLTAASNWTGRVTARGGLLGTLVGLWIAARLALLMPQTALNWPIILLDVAFLPALAAVLAAALLRTRNYRNILFPVGLLLLALLNLSVHLSALGLTTWTPERAMWLAISLITAMMVVMGGRVIPAFTANAMPEIGARRIDSLDLAAIASIVALLLVELFTGSGPLVGIVALTAGAANLARMMPWRGWATWQRPILLVLHVGYLWIAVGLVLRGLAQFTAIVPPDAGLHALAAGAIGTLTLGMMTRVALGHSGRPLTVGHAVVLSYLLIVLAGLLRVLAAFPVPQYDHVLALSGLPWALAFGIFTIAYFPILTRPRIDGKPG